MQENKKLHESVPENHVASMQEELAAVKLREAEANLALKDLKAKVFELSGMWQKHLKRSEAAKLEAGEAPPSTPKKLFGSLLEGKSEAARLEEELMTARMTEVESQAELKDQRLKIMDLETHVRFLVEGKASLLPVNRIFYGSALNVANLSVITSKDDFTFVIFVLQNQVIANQLKRQNDELIKLRENLEAKNISELRLQVGLE